MYEVTFLVVKTSEQIAPKLLAEIISEQENTSKDTVKRYIRLTELIKPLLDLVDEGKIARTLAEKLSYLNEEEKNALVEMIQDYEATPSLSQAVRLEEGKREFEEWQAKKEAEEADKKGVIISMCANMSAHLSVVIF